MATRVLQEREDAPTDARQVRSRKALTGAMLALLEEKPFDQITIREISARSGTGYATFFRHYTDKEALLGDVASQEISHLLGMATPVLYDINSHASTLAMCDYVDEHRALWSALLIGGAASIVREEFIRQARLLVGKSILSESWLPADLGVIYGTGGTIDLLAWWLAQEERYSPTQIAGILNRLIIAPLVGKLGTVVPQTA